MQEKGSYCLLKLYCEFYVAFVLAVKKMGEAVPIESLASNNFKITLYSPGYLGILLLLLRKP